MKLKHYGLLVGLLAGFAWMWLGVGRMLVVLVVGVIGYVVGGVLDGEIDLQKYIDSFRRK